MARESRDIVKNLRVYAKQVPVVLSIAALKTILTDAADEIERLRREVDSQTARKAAWFDEASRRGLRLSEVIEELEIARNV